jgi:hypothetical protein
MILRHQAVVAPIQNHVHFRIHPRLECGSKSKPRDAVGPLTQVVTQT